MTEAIALPPDVHIGLNLVYLVPGEVGGMEMYARELIPALLAEQPNLRMTAFINREATEARDGPWHDLVTAVTVPVNARRRSEWVRGEQQLLPGLAHEAGVHLVHSLASTAPARGRFRRVVTIQDVIYRVYPEAHFGVRSLGMRVLVSLGARRANRIVVPSQNTRDDVVKHLGVPARRIDVVPLGAGTTRRASPVPAAEVRRRYDLRERPLLLTVSARRPHKNLPRLLDALALIAPSARPVLVLPGYPTPHDDELRQRVARHGLEADVRLLDWVSPEELEGLYEAAACFVFPSLYEGFGLPVLEAMARGVPVACSNRGSLAEVAGGAALIFDPESPPAIAAAVETILADSGEADRLRHLGRERAARFSWESTARGTLVSYGRALVERS